MKVCDRCGKSTHVVIARSHSMIASRRKQKPNLQRRLVGGRRLRLCTSCWSMVRKQDQPRAQRAKAP